MKEKPVIVSLLSGLIVILVIGGVSVLVKMKKTDERYQQQVSRSIELNKNIDALQKENEELQSTVDSLEAEVTELEAEIVKIEKLKEKLEENLKEELVADEQADGIPQ
ncbi:MAG: hypothetical protein GF333_06385 [Candidatus Omnitrophica bacterium]|nr:hypothetical protein [Candidatus Omnitrophota bacterium]